MKKLFITPILLSILLLSACADSPDNVPEEATTESSTSTEATVAAWDGVNAVYYNGIRYYGLVMADIQMPEGVECLGETHESSTSDIWGTHFEGDRVPTEQLQTNWTGPGKLIYAEYDENGEIVRFWLEKDEYSENIWYMGDRVNGVSVTTPDYYILPDGEEPVKKSTE